MSLRFDVKPEHDAEVLHAVKTLQKVNDKPAEFGKDQ